MESLSGIGAYTIFSVDPNPSLTCTNRLISEVMLADYDDDDHHHHSLLTVSDVFKSYDTVLLFQQLMKGSSPLN